MANPTHTRHRPALRDRRLADQTARSLARGLGWFSVGLGVVELFGAKSLARWLGMETHETLIRTYGAREIATGIGVLTARDPTPWIWARVAGDALDLATLGRGLTDSDTEQDRVGFVAAAVAGVTMLDVICAESLGQIHESAEEVRDYSARSGLPRPAHQMRGAARDFEVPHDMRIPEALRPFPQGDDGIPKGGGRR